MGETSGTQKESYPARGEKRGSGHRRKNRREAGRAEGEEVSVIKLRGNPKFHFQPIYAARDNATRARAHAGLFFPQIPFSNSKRPPLSPPLVFLATR